MVVCWKNMIIMVKSCEQVKLLICCQSILLIFGGSSSIPCQLASSLLRVTDCQVILQENGNYTSAQQKKGVGILGCGLLINRSQD